jgi:hypothetical protein
VSRAEPLGAALVAALGAACIPTLGYVECFRGEDCPSSSCDVAARRCLPAVSADAGPRDGGSRLDATSEDAAWDDAAVDDAGLVCSPIPGTRWQAPVPMSGIDPNVDFLGGQIAEEGAGPELYLSTSLWQPLGMSGYPTQIGRTLLVGPATVSTAFVHLTSLDMAGMGWVNAPSLSVDGLEIFFSASYPAADWMNYHIFHAYRASVADDWSAPEMLLGGFGDMFPSLLLPDGKTLLYYELTGSIAVPFMRVATRDTTDPSSSAFQAAGTTTLPAGAARIGCDQRSLVMIRAHDGMPVRARILSFAPLQFDPCVEPISYPPPGNPMETPEALFESPDCKKLYISYRGGDTWRAISTIYVADPMP